MDKAIRADILIILKDYLDEDNVDKTIDELSSILGKSFYDRFVKEMEKRNYVYDKEAGIRHYSNRDVNEAAKSVLLWDTKMKLIKLEITVDDKVNSVTLAALVHSLNIVEDVRIVSVKKDETSKD